MSARHVLRDLRIERGEKPAEDSRTELREAIHIQREDSAERDPVARELASEVVDSAGPVACLLALGNWTHR